MVTSDVQKQIQIIRVSCYFVIVTGLKCWFTPIFKYHISSWKQMGFSSIYPGLEISTAEVSAVVLIQLIECHSICSSYRFASLAATSFIETTSQQRNNP